MNEPRTLSETEILTKDFNEMSDEEFTRSLDYLRKPSKDDIKRFMQLMNNNKPENTKRKAAQKKKNRAKNKVARKSRIINKK